jgi:hypothetical protein
VFNAFLSSRAVPATPEERFGALTEHLPEACCLRPLCRGSASSCTLEATSRFAARYGPRFRSRRIAARRHPGSASTGHLAASRREPGYSIAQSLIEVGSFHPTRNAPLHGAHKVELERDRFPRSVRLSLSKKKPQRPQRPQRKGSSADQRLSGGFYFDREVEKALTNR